MKEKFSLKELKNILFKNVGKDKILIIIMVGILLVIITLPTKSTGTSSKSNTTNTTSNTNTISTTDYEKYLEDKIADLLAKVQGVGKVKVMVTVKASSEKVLVNQDTYSENTVKETDSDGGIRESIDKSGSQSYLTSDTGNGNEPYVTKEKSPEVEGVMVIAEGGADSTVATNITNAIAALLDVPVHKIQVLKMSN